MWLAWCLVGFVAGGLLGLHLLHAQGISFRWIVGLLRIALYLVTASTLLALAVLGALWAGAQYTRVTCVLIAFPGCTRPLFLIPGLPALSAGGIMGAYPFLATMGLQWMCLIKSDELRRGAVPQTFRPQSPIFQGFALAGLLRRTLLEDWSPLVVGIGLEAVLSYARTNQDALQLGGSADGRWISFAGLMAISTGAVLLVKSLAWIAYRPLRSCSFVWASAEESPTQLVEFAHRLFESAGLLLRTLYERTAEATGFAAIRLVDASRKIGDDAVVLLEKTESGRLSGVNGHDARGEQ